MKNGLYKVTVNRVPNGEYLVAGETYIADVMGKQDVRFRCLDDSSGTYVRRHWFNAAIADGSFVLVGG